MPPAHNCVFTGAALSALEALLTGLELTNVAELYALEKHEGANVGVDMPAIRRGKSRRCGLHKSDYLVLTCRLCAAR